MYLTLAFVWLLGGVGLLAVQMAGYSLGRIGPLGYVFCFVLSLFNFARWYASRSGKDDEAAARIALEARKRGARDRYREPEYDPNLDFTKKDDGVNPPQA